MPGQEFNFKGFVEAILGNESPKVKVKKPTDQVCVTKKRSILNVYLKGTSGSISVGIPITKGEKFDAPYRDFIDWIEDGTRDDAFNFSDDTSLYGVVRKHITSYTITVEDYKEPQTTISE